MSQPIAGKLNLTDIPIEVLLENLLPVIPVPDLLNLTCCNKFFSVLCIDDTVWKRKLSEDFNFSGQGTARTSGWKFIYRGLFKPRVFVWGEKTHGRLGLPSVPKSVVPGLPYPMQVPLPNVRIVSLVAGGMSFHALDSDGSVHVWGSLDGRAYRPKQVTTPHRLSLPVPIRSISCGRLHSSCLDRANKIWTFTNWDRPFCLSSPILCDPEYAPKQIECGWTFSSLLTKSGDVFVWWPFGGSMGQAVEQKMRDMDQETDTTAYATTDSKTIHCKTWDLDMVPTRLPQLPALPELPNIGDVNNAQHITLIQIAAFDNHIVGLTNRGHVLKYGSLHDEAGVPHGRWEYLPQFSEVARVKDQPAFSDESNSAKLEAPQTMQITHITANFVNFVAYSTGSSSIVLVGDTNSKPDSPPKIIPELQNRSIISVVIGDYHNAALTANGKLMTWGKYSNGALGLGDPLKLEPGTPGGFADFAARRTAEERRRGEPPAVNVPSEVRFDHNNKKPRDRFCFATTAAGWHTGALVIDLESGEEEEIVQSQSDASPLIAGPSRRQWESPPMIPLPGIFRMGHAARGNFRGGVGGVHRRPQPNDGEPS